MSKKVLYIINHMDWFWSHRLSLALEAKKRGWEVLICAPGADTDSKLAEYGFKGFALNKIYGPVCVWRAIQKIRRVIDVEKPDLIHAITLKFAFPAGLAAHGRDINVLHTIAGLGYLFAGDGWKPKLLRSCVAPFFKRAFISKRTKIIFQNPDDLELMTKRGFADKNQSFLIKGSGVDLQQFTASPVPDTKPPLVLFPTRLVWEKGIIVFIAAAKALEDKDVKARYVIAGGIRKNTPNAIKHSEMEDAMAGSPVEWLGHVEDMPKLLQQSALIAYPSWYGEGVPKVLLEAAATGRAIITTDHPGCREVVEECENGYLIPIKDEQALAGAIENALSNMQALNQMGARSREIAEAEFDVKSVNQRTLDIYGSF